ncbi:MAG: TolC family protein [Pseudomonadota bacterium]
MRARPTLRSIAFHTTVVLLASAVVASTAVANSSPSTLSDVYERALAQDPVLETARTKKLIGEREFRDALYGYFPRIFARLDRDRRYQSILSSDNQVFALGKAEYSITQALLEVRQPLIDYGRFARMKRGRALRSRSFAEFALERQRLIVRVIEAYFLALAAAERVVLVKSAQAAILVELRDAQERAEAGRASRSDLLELRAQAELAASELIEAQNRLGDRLDIIGEIIGSSPKRLAAFSVVPPLSPLSIRSVKELMDSAKRSNQELQIQKLTIAAARFDRNQEIGEYLPKLEFKGSIDYTDQEGSQFGGGSETRDVTVGLRLEIPIFNMNGLGRPHIKKNHEITVEQLKLKQLHVRISREISGFVRSLRGAIQKFRALGRVVESNRGRLDDLSAKRRSGVATSVDVLKAQRDLVRAKRDQFDAVVEYILAITRLKAAIGVIGDADIEHLNQYLL